MYRRITQPPAGEQTPPWLPYETWRRLGTSLTAVETVAAYGVRETTIGRGPSARLGRVGMTLGPFFALLGTAPAAGRLFGPDEDAARDGPLAILSERVRRDDFGGSAAALGGSIVIDGAPHTIVGVAPAGFTGPELTRVDAWILGDTRRAASYNWRVAARLRPDASLAQLGRELARFRASPPDDEPRWMANAELLAAPIRCDDTARDSMQARMAWWMTAVAVAILLIATANVINLLLVRLARRQRELGVRVALGSGRARVVRLVALDGVLLSAAGGGVGVWLAAAFGPAARAALFPGGGDWIDAAIDTRLLATVAAIGGLVAAAVAVVPALGFRADQLTRSLRARTDRGAARSHVRAGLTIAQTALSVVLLAGAGLFIRSVIQVAGVELGADPDRVLVVEAWLDQAPVPEDRAVFPAWLADLAATERRIYRQAVETIRADAGVESASVALGLPLYDGSFSDALLVPGLDRVPSLPGGGPFISAVGDGYFETVGTRIARGRAFRPADREGSEAVAIVSETTAARLWPGDEAVGRCLRIGDRAAPCARVVGIAADVHRASLTEAPSLQVYVPYGQERGFAGARIVVRPTADAPIAWPALRRAVYEAGAGVRVGAVRSLSDSLNRELRPLRLGLATFGASAAVAVVTAALGLYGVMSYAVAWRRREIGIRLALGATGADVRRLVAGNGLALAGVGILAGLLLSAGGGRWLEPQLFQTSARDPYVLSGVAVLVAAVALVAGIVPAVRATRIPPAESLRAE